MQLYRYTIENIGYIVQPFRLNFELKIIPPMI